MNTSFLLIKPEVCTVPFVEFACNFLEESGVRVDDVAIIPGDEVARQQWAVQHYGAVHHYAMADTASVNELIHNREEAKSIFFSAYHELWDTVVEEGRLMTAQDAMTMLGNLSAKEMSERWHANGDFFIQNTLAHVSCSPVKLFRGFYVMRLAKENVYVINGFYPAVLESLTDSDQQVCRLSLSWPETQMSWADFLEAVIGSPDPEQAAPTSLRYALCSQYPDLGIRHAPTKAWNGFDVASNPVEALAYRCIWTRRGIEEDDYGRALLQEGIPYMFVERVLGNPIIIQSGEITSPFEILICKNSSQAIRRLAELYVFLKQEDDRMEADASAERKVFVFDRQSNISISLPEGCQEELDAVRNTALILLKPHADNPNVFKAVTDLLKEQVDGIEIESVVDIDSELVRSKNIVDRHYGTISLYALRRTPAEIEVGSVEEEAFETAFGVPWKEAVAAGHVWNAGTALHMLGCISPAELFEIWNTHHEKQKLCSGAYVCRIPQEDQGHDVFVINGFYPHVHSMFTAPGARVRCLVVSWPEKNLTWELFRANVVGCTDPAKAHSSSLRGALASTWLKLGLKAPLNVTENAIHASASPLEAAVERHLWLGTPLEQDVLSGLWSRHGISPALLMRWTTNPLSTNKILNETKRVFDMAENMQTSEFLRMGREAEQATLRTDTEEAVNRAVVLLHPPAATASAIALVNDVLVRGNITVRAQGDYFSYDAHTRVMNTPAMRTVAKYAALGGEELFKAIPTDAKVNFQLAFEKDWEFNAEIISGAAVACKELDVTPSELMKKWSDADPVRIARHCYVAFVRSYQRYVVNGFHPFMEEIYKAPGARMHYFDVEWKESVWQWEDFNNVVIGNTDISKCAAGTLQRSISEAWRELGLPERPCHRAQCSISASVGPLEAIADRVVWLPSELQVDQRLSEDVYTQRLLMEGVPLHLIAHYAAGYKTVHLLATVEQEKALLREVSVGKQSSECARRLRAVSLEIQRASKQNYSFLWIHPSSAKDGFELNLPDILESHGVTIRSSGQLTLDEAMERDLINSPFTSLYRNAYVRRAAEVTISVEERAMFKSVFGITWETATELSIMINAKEAVERYGETYVIECWENIPKKVCLSPHLYVGYMEVEGVYVINGFYPLVRARLHNGSKALWYSLSWDPSHMSWEEYLVKVIGDEDPQAAVSGSLRHHLLENWERYDLDGPPDLVENGVHASNTPIEALAERCLWWNTLPEEDVVGRLLLQHGVNVDFLQDVLRNPAVYQQSGCVGDITEIFNLLPNHTTGLEQVLLHWQHSHILSLLPEGTFITNPKPDLLVNELPVAEREARQLRAVLQQAVAAVEYPSPLEALVSVPLEEEEEECTDYSDADAHRAYAVITISPEYTVNPKGRQLLRQVLTDLLRDHHIQVVLEGHITGVVAEDRRVFDVQHRRLVQYATKDTAAEILADEEVRAVLEKSFGEAFSPGCLRNAVQIQEEFDLTAKKVDQVWKHCDPIIRAAPDLYVGKVPSDDLFIVNGFVPQARDAFYNIAHDKHFMVVTWHDRWLSYPHFLSRVIGDCRISEAQPHSFHGMLRDRWAKLGMDVAPHPYMGVVQVSDSALCAMQHRQLWLDLGLDTDPVGRAAMVEPEGVSPFILRWATSNPVTTPGGPLLLSSAHGINTEDTLQLLHQLERDYRSEPARNTAMLMVKPHALGRRFARRIEHVLAKHNVRIEEEGDLSGRLVHERGLLRHLYPAVAGYAVRNPASIVLTAAEKENVEQALGVTWPELIYGGVLLHAYAALERLGNITPQQLYVYWKASRTRVRVRPDMEVTALEDYGLFVVNGFFPALKESFESPRALLHWYVVSWAEGELSWSDFMQTVVGANEPSEAAPRSIRGQLFRHWREYGLHSIPDRVQNGVHASSGPWHAMAERLHVVQPHLVQDPLGDALVRHNVHDGLIDMWLTNPDVDADGITAGVFEHLTHYDTTPLVDTLASLSKDLHRIQALRDLEEDALLARAALTNTALQNPGVDDKDEVPELEPEDVLGASWRSAPQPDEDPILYRNTAMLILKPHIAGQPEALQLLRTILKNNMIRIVSEAFQDSTARLIDRLYFTEAFFALHSCLVRFLRDGGDIPSSSKRRFADMFGESWGNVTAATNTSSRLLSAVEAMQRLRVNPEELYTLATAPSQPVLRIGHHIAIVKLVKQDVYVVNATYPFIRQRMEQSDNCNTIGTFVIAFDERIVSWKKLRESIIGHEDPAQAEEGSFRQQLLAKWQALGLTAAPTAVENGVRESIGPLQAYAERTAWFGVPNAIPDALTRSLCAADADPSMLEIWAQNPLVEYAGQQQPQHEGDETEESEPQQRTIVRRIFDLLVDHNTRDVISLIRGAEDHFTVLSTGNDLRVREELGPRYDTFKPQAPRMHPPLPPPAPRAVAAEKASLVISGPSREQNKLLDIAQPPTPTMPDGTVAAAAVSIPTAHVGDRHPIDLTPSVSSPRGKIQTAKLRDALLHATSDYDLHAIFSYYHGLDPVPEAASESKASKIMRTAPNNKGKGEEPPTISSALFLRDFENLETFGVPLQRHRVRSLFSAAEARGGRMRYDEFARAMATYRSM